MKNKHKIFLALLLLMIILGFAQAFKKSGDQLVEQIAPVQKVDQTPTSPVYQEPVIVPPTQPTPSSNNGCYVGGCSGQICSDQPNTVSTCEFSPAYSCYQANITTCERQSNGQCGWTQTAALQQCLAENPAQFQ